MALTTTLRDDEIASIRLTVQQYLVDTAVNSRTGLSTRCRLRALPSTVTIPHMPPMVVMTEFVITLPNGTDVVGGDLETLTDHETNGSMGVFYVSNEMYPRSNSPSLKVRCVQRTLENGKINLNTNHTIYFQQQSSPYYLSSAVNAYVEPVTALNPEVIRDLGMTASDFLAWFDPLTVKDNKTATQFNPDVQDRLLWSFALDRNKNMKACPIKIIMPSFELGAWMAVFSVPGGINQ